MSGLKGQHPLCCFIKALENYNGRSRGSAWEKKGAARSLSLFWEVLIGFYLAPLLHIVSRCDDYHVPLSRSNGPRFSIFQYQEGRYGGSGSDLTTPLRRLLCSIASISDQMNNYLKVLVHQCRTTKEHYSNLNIRDRYCDCGRFNTNHNMSSCELIHCQVCTNVKKMFRSWSTIDDGCFEAGGKCTLCSHVKVGFECTIPCQKNMEKTSWEN